MWKPVYSWASRSQHASSQLSSWAQQLPSPAAPVYDRSHQSITSTQHHQPIITIHGESNAYWCNNNNRGCKSNRQKLKQNQFCSSNFALAASMTAVPILNRKCPKKWELGFQTSYNKAPVKDNSLSLVVTYRIWSMACQKIVKHTNKVLKLNVTSGQKHQLWWV